jgi:hypothetical protein
MLKNSSKSAAKRSGHLFCVEAKKPVDFFREKLETKKQVDFFREKLEINKKADFIQEKLETKNIVLCPW